MLIPIIMGIARRVYGANKGHFPFNRLLTYSLPVGVSVYFMLGGPIWAALAHVAAAYIGMSLSDISPYWNLKDKREWFMMALHGMLKIAPIAILASTFNPAHGFIWLSGLLLPVGYWLGNKMPTVNKQYLNRGKEWSEFLGHMLIGYAIYFMAGV